jgi:uncharacterized protein (DUF488 family)
VTSIRLRSSVSCIIDDEVKIFTLGFTKTSAAHFFDRLTTSRAKALIDVRLNNVSQLAGFAKRDDLRYFTNAICGIQYRHELRLAPTQNMLDNFRKPGGGWGSYQQQFLKLISERDVESMDREVFDGACLLCSENEPHHCHRRLVAEYLDEKWGGIEIIHL